MMWKYYYGPVVVCRSSDWTISGGPDSSIARHYPACTIQGGHRWKPRFKTMWVMRNWQVLAHMGNHSELILNPYQGQSNRGSMKVWRMPVMRSRKQGRYPTSVQQLHARGSSTTRDRTSGLPPWHGQVRCWSMQAVVVIYENDMT